MRHICVLLAAIMSACTHSSGVLSVAPDTYSVSAVASPSRGGVAAAKRIALEQANEHYSKQDKQILTVGSDGGTTNAYGDGSAEITFKCVDKSAK
jgi:hypothetical protein